jgi:hypothetical protein
MQTLQGNNTAALDAIKKARQTPIPAEIAKAFDVPGSAITGIQGYDLWQGAQEFYAVTDLFRRMIPRVQGGYSIQANWRQITAINPSNVSGAVEAGKRGASMDQTVSAKLAAFVSRNLENNVVWQAYLAGQQFEDLYALAVKEMLQATMEDEERLILGGLGTYGLGITPTPTAAWATTGGSIAAGAYILNCVALTYDGKWQSTSTAVKLPYTRNNNDGTTTVIQGFAAQKSANATHTFATGVTTGSVTASVTPVPGAFGYAWFLGTSGNQRLAAITSLNSVAITAVPASPQQAMSTHFDTDTSRNSLAYDGLFSQIYASGSGSYVQALATGTAGVGTKLTSTGDGTAGIQQIDDALQAFVDNYRLCPDTIACSTSDYPTLRKLLLDGNTNLAPFIAAGGTVSGSGVITGYRNPTGFSTPTLDFMAHPWIPQGTIMFYSKSNPYPLSNVGTICRIYLRRDYTQYEWPMTTFNQFFSIFWDGVLQHFFPPAMGAIYNIAPGA